MITLDSFLIIGAALFILGFLAVLTKRNAISVLMGIELILNAVNLNFVAFGCFRSYELHGVLIALFVLVIAVSEAAVALAIVLNIYRNVQTVHLDEVDSLKK